MWSCFVWWWWSNWTGRWTKVGGGSKRETEFAHLCSLHTYVEIVGSKPESWLPAELVRDVMPVPSWLPMSSTQLSPTRLYPGSVVALGTNSHEANAGPSNRTRPANSPHQAQRGQVVGLEAANEGLVCPHPLMAPSAVSSIAASNAFPQLGSLRDCQPWIAIGFVVKLT